MTTTITWEQHYHPGELAAKELPRSVLNHVLIDAAGYLVATNGLSISVIPYRAEGDPIPDSGWLVPATIFSHTPTQNPSITITDDYASTIGKDGCEIRVKLGQATFVAWRNFLPKVTNKPVTLAAVLTEQSRRALGRKNVAPYVANDGDLTHAVALSDGTALIIQMPTFTNPDISELQALIETMRGEA